MNLENVLNQQIADFNVLYTKLHRFHWYVKGPQFFTLHEKFEEFFGKETLLNQIDGNIFWYDDMPVYVPPDDPDGKRVHTIVQTISQYRYLNKLDRILKMLHNKRSKFIFPLHDSIILSLRKDEEEIIDAVFEILEDDVYKIKAYMGPNYRDITEI